MSSGKESDHGSNNITDNPSNRDTLSSLSGDGNSCNEATSSIASNMVENTYRPNISGLRIDHLIAAQGYGYVQDVEVMFLPHHSHSHAIEGSEVQFVEGERPTKFSKNGHSPKILCRMSVSPVLSAEWHHAYTDTISPHQSRSNGRRRSTRSKPNKLKHYLIQLEAADGPRFLVSRTSNASSSTDTTTAAQLLGITKIDVHARRGRRKRCQNQNQREELEQRGVEESHDENASIEPVATCG